MRADGLRLNLEYFEQPSIRMTIIFQSEQSISQLRMKDHLLMKELDLILIISPNHVFESMDMSQVITLIKNDLQLFMIEGVSLNEIEG